MALSLFFVQLAISLLKFLSLAPIKGSGAEVIFGKSIDFMEKKILGKLEEWLKIKESEIKIQIVIQKTERCFAKSNAPRSIREAIHQINLLNERALIHAINKLPGEMDDHEIREAIEHAFLRDVGKHFTALQIKQATDEYLRCMRRALLTFKDTSSAVVGQTVMRIDNAIEVLVQGLAHPSIYLHAGQIQNFLTDYLDAPFGGRELELTKMNTWFFKPDSPPYLLLAAEAGRGKSALLTHWIQTFLKSNQVHVAFIPISIRYNTAQASVVFQALAARLGEIYGETIASPHLTAEEWKGVCLHYMEQIPPDGKPLLVVLDGLDEAIGWQAGPDLLPRKSPTGFRAVVSARYQAGDIDEIGWLKRLGWERPGQAHHLSLPLLNEVGMQDVLQKMGNPLDKLSTDVDIIYELFRLSQGDPLLVRLYIEALLPYGEQVVVLQPEALTKMTPGLYGYLNQWWEDQRHQWGEESPIKEEAIQTVLNLLACALAPIPKHDLIELAPKESGLNTFMLEFALDKLRRFIIGDGKDQGYVFSHPRLSSFFYERLQSSERYYWERIFLLYGKRNLEIAIQNAENLQPLPIYALQTYGMHLERTESPSEDLYALLCKGWMKSWYNFERGYSGFLSDVDRVWKRANKEKNIGIQIKCSLCRSSVHTLSSNIPPDLLKQLIENSLMTSVQALVIIENNSNEHQKAMQLHGITPILPKGLFPSVLQVIKGIKHEGIQARALTELAPYLPSELIPLSLQIAQKMWHDEALANAISGLARYLPSGLLPNAVQLAMEIENSEACIQSLVALIPHLPPPQRSTLLDTALQKAEIIKGKWSRALSLSKLVPLIPENHRPRVLAKALRAAQNIEDESYRVRALTWLLPHLSSNIQYKVLTTTLEAAYSIKNEEVHVYSLIRLIPYLKPEQHFGVLSDALKKIKEINLEVDRTKALTKLAPWLVPDLLSDALQVAQLIKDEWYVAEAINGLAPHLDSVLISTAIQIVQDFVDEGARLLAFSGLFPFLHPDQQSDLIDPALQAVQNVEYEWEQVRILSMLAPNVQPDKRMLLLASALQATQTILDERSRIEAIVDVFPHLSPEKQAIAFYVLSDEMRTYNILDLIPYMSANLLSVALKYVQNIEDENERAHSLVKLVPCLSPELLSIALPIVQDIHDEEKRLQTLIGLIPHLPSEQFPAVLQMVQNIEHKKATKEYVEILIQLASRISHDEGYELLTTALQIGQGIEDKWDRAIALIDLTPHFPAPKSQKVLSIALQVVEEIEEFSALEPDKFLHGLARSGDLARALSKIVPYLQPQQILTALQIVTKIEVSSDFLFILTELAPVLPLELLPIALQITKDFQDEYYRTRALSELAPYLPTNLLLEALEIAKEIQDDYDRAIAVAYLYPHLPSELKTEVMHFLNDIEDEGIRAQALVEIIPHLPSEQLPAILEAVYKIRSDYGFAQALTQLAPYLPPELHETAIHYLLEIVDVWKKAEALTALAPHLSPELLSIALQIALTTRYAREHALSGLTPSLVNWASKDQEASYQEWMNLLPRLAQNPREEMIKEVKILFPFMLALIPTETEVETASAEIFEALQDVCSWWPVAKEFYRKLDWAKSGFFDPVLYED